jgi:hypothetical protein
MKISKLRILGAVVGVLAAGAAVAGKPPRNTAPVVQLPPGGEVAVVPTAEAGPTVTLPPPRDEYAAAKAPAAKAPAPTVETQARSENTRLRGGENGPVVELPQK